MPPAPGSVNALLLSLGFAVANQGCSDEPSFVGNGPAYCDGAPGPCSLTDAASEDAPQEAPSDATADAFDARQAAPQDAAGDAGDGE